MLFRNQRRLMPSLWSGCKVQKRDSLSHNIDGDCCHTTKINLWGVAQM